MLGYGKTIVVVAGVGLWKDLFSSSRCWLVEIPL